MKLRYSKPCRVCQSKKHTALYHIRMAEKAAKGDNDIYRALMVDL